ncbi:MAG: RNB domain-containing ribonuclease [bacterium]|nr:RNB domain-containing ribonuclease [bacterium]
METIYKDKPTCAFVKQVKGKKLIVILPTGKEEILDMDEIIHVGIQKSSADIQDLVEKNKLRDQIKQIFNLHELWDILEEKEYDTILVLELYLGRKPTDDEVAGFYRKIIETNNFFKIINNDKIIKLSEKEVNEILERQRKEKEKIQKEQEKIKNQQELIKTITKLINLQDIEEQEKIWIEKLKNYVVSSEKDELVEETLKIKKIDNHPKIFDLLVKNNFVDPDYFYELYRLKFPEFTEKDLQESAEIFKKEINLEQSVDLTHLNTFTIDSEETKDFDDAISVEVTDRKTILYVHISNVSLFIKPGSNLFEKALCRMQTLYLPDNVIPMLPTELSEEKFSLKKGELRNTLTFKFEISINDLSIINFEPIISLIKVKNRFTYSEIDKEIESGEKFWNTLYKIMSEHKNYRLQRGALIIFLPEIIVRVINGELKIKKIEMTKARDFVSEAMILTNYYSAQFMEKNNIPALYRTQRDPQKIIPINNIVDMLNQLKYIHKVEFSTIPKPHSGLGLKCYLTLTSPIRRFIDLLNQYQLLSFLTGIPTLTENDILKMLPEIESNIQRAQYLQTRRNRYFLLKFLSNYKERTKGIILEKDKNGAKVYLPEFNIIGKLKGNYSETKTNQEIKVTIKKCNPYTEEIDLELYQEGELW